MDTFLATNPKCSTIRAAMKTVNFIQGRPITVWHDVEFYYAGSKQKLTENLLIQNK